jgi:S-adenosylmethionine:tRNA ribosyltransferase-isomerase
LGKACVNTSDFDYHLPESLIAQQAVEPRDHARLLVHRLRANTTEHAQVRDLPRLLEPGDLCVFNNTRVVPARLLGERKSGGKVELLLLEPVPTRGPRAWRALARPAARLAAGEELCMEQGAIVVRLLERLQEADGRPSARWEIDFAGDQPVLQLLEAHGRMPLPPYIARSAGDPRHQADKQRYQTVYARQPGAVAAPTAGLHFTPELLRALDAAGVPRAEVTLHVGLGTFQPVSAERLVDHRMHSERYELDSAAAQAVASVRQRGGRVVAIGTTSVRVLESCHDGHRGVRAACGATEIFLHPGNPPRVIDALFTNFHLPKSTLLMLVSAFAGRERVLELYREAIEREYRFYSYGDALLLLP